MCKIILFIDFIFERERKRERVKKDVLFQPKIKQKLNININKPESIFEIGLTKK